MGSWMDRNDSMKLAVRMGSKGDEESPRKVGKSEKKREKREKAIKSAGDKPQMSKECVSHRLNEAGLS